MAGSKRLTVKRYLGYKLAGIVSAYFFDNIKPKGVAVALGKLNEAALMVGFRINYLIEVEMRLQKPIGNKLLAGIEAVVEVEGAY